MCPKDNDAPAGAHYLIVLHDCVVLQDIADTILDFDRNAQVISVTSDTDALEALAGVQNVAIAFIEAAPDTFLKSALAPELTVRGARFVYLGDAAEDALEKDDVRVLRRPFSSEIILGHLAVLQPK